MSHIRLASACRLWVTLHGRFTSLADDGPIAEVVEAGYISEPSANGTLKTYKDFPHGMPTTQADTINANLLAFMKA